MTCKDIQELMAGDFEDGACNPRDARAIQDHLRACSVCRHVEAVLRAQRDLLRTARREPVPAHLWSNIRHAIAAERLHAEHHRRRKSFATLRDFWPMRPPVFALASGFAVILLIVAATGITMHRQQGLQAFDVAEYSLTNNKTAVLDDLGTTIEEYFL